VILLENLQDTEVRETPSKSAAKRETQACPGGREG
jgi:hypothetical protein